MLEWDVMFIGLCCFFWLFVYFFFLGPFIVWLTGESDIDLNPSNTSKHTNSVYSQPNRSQAPKRQIGKKNGA